MKKTNLEQMNSLPGYKLLRCYETGMSILLVGLAVFHIMVSSLRYIIIEHVRKSL